jgi:hypothetical protein
VLLPQSSTVGRPSEPCRAGPPSSTPAATYRHLGAGQRRRRLRAVLPLVCVMPEHRSTAASRVLSCSYASCAASLASLARGEGSTMGHVLGARRDADHPQVQRMHHKLLDIFFSVLSCIVSVSFYMGFLPPLSWNGHWTPQAMTFPPAKCSMLCPKGYLT